MRRREFITLLGGAAAAWPLAARAQQPAMPVIGILSAVPRRPRGSPHLAAFRQGPEAKPVTSRARTSRSNIDGRRADTIGCRRWPPNWFGRQVAVIVAIGNTAALAAKAATTTIPIVFDDRRRPGRAWPRRQPQRPGGNLTGVTTSNAEVGPKRLELLHELLPKAAAMAVLVNPTNPNAETVRKETQAAARILGLQAVIVLSASQSNATSK